MYFRCNILKLTKRGVGPSNELNLKKLFEIVRVTLHRIYMPSREHTGTSLRKYSKMLLSTFIHFRIGKFTYHCNVVLVLVT